MKEKDNEGNVATKSTDTPNKLEAMKVPLKVVREDPVTGVKQHTVREVTVAEALKLAQKGDRMEQKLGNINAEIDRKAEIKAMKMAKELAKEEAKRLVPEAKTTMNELLTEEDLLQGDPNKLVSALKTMDAKYKVLESKIAAQEAMEKEVQELAATYDQKIDEAVERYPGLKPTELAEFIQSMNIPPDRVEGAAAFLAKNKSVDLDQVAPEDIKKIENEIRESLVAPTTVPEGPTTRTVTKEEKVKEWHGKDLTAEDIYDKSIEYLKKMETSGGLN
jgi:hypothetical protein